MNQVLKPNWNEEQIRIIRMVSEQTEADMAYVKGMPIDATLACKGIKCRDCPVFSYIEQGGIQEGDDQTCEATATKMLAEIGGQS